MSSGEKVLRNVTALAWVAVTACGGSTVSDLGTEPGRDAGGVEDATPRADGAPRSDAGGRADAGGGGGTTCGPAGSSTACIPEKVGTVTTSAGITSIADDATHVYVADEGGDIHVIDVATGAETLVASLGSVNGGTELAVGANDVFFSTDGAIGSVPKTGGAVTNLVTGQNGGSGIAATGTTLVWSETFTNGVTGGSSGQIFSLPISGGTPTSLASKLEILFGPITDGTTAYWLESGTIASVPLAGGAVKVLETNVDSAEMIATDGVNVYWADDDAQIGTCGLCPPPPPPTAIDSSIYKAPIKGGTPTLVTQGYRIDTVAVDGTNVYWFDTNAMTLSTVPAAGGTPIVLAKGVGSGSGLLVDTPYIYWIASDGTLMRMAKQPG